MACDQMPRKSRKKIAVIALVDVFVAAKLFLSVVGDAGRVPCSNLSSIHSLATVSFSCILASVLVDGHIRYRNKCPSL